MSPVSRAVVVVLIALGAVGAAAVPASAHATLVSVTPGPGSTQAQAPTTVTLRFDENVQSSSKVVVQGPSGRVDHGEVSAVDDHVDVDVRLEPRPAYVGTYVIAYRVISADGHPVTGQSRFEYRPPGVTAAPPDARRDTAAPSRSPLWWIIGGVVVVVAAGALLLLPRRRSGRR